MKERDRTDPLEPRGAILDPEAARRAFEIVRLPPPEDLSPFVRHYWFLRWDLPDGATHTQSVVPLPAANAVIEEATDSVSLAGMHRFDRTLSGRGAVFGTTFMPTGLSAVAHRPARHFVAPRRFADVFSGDPEPLRRLAFGGARDSKIAAALDGYWRAQQPRIDPRAAQLEAAVARAIRDPTIGRADVLAAELDMRPRTLERRMRELVGFSPKQLLRRCRLLEASARLEAGQDVDHAALAQSLGYADQAHFVRDFRAACGRSPGRYAKTLRAPTAERSPRKRAR